jgi:hypothetical protein
MTDEGAPVMRIILEEDSTPLVLAVGTRLRAAARSSELRVLMAKTLGTVVLKSSRDPQSATLRFSAGAVFVAHGVTDDADVVLEFDPEIEFEFASSDCALGATVSRLLNPPLLTWDAAAERFWELTSSDAGMPDRLVVVCTDVETEVRFGEGPTEYVVQGSAHQLSRTLSGHGNFIAEVAAGAISIVGTLPHLSVMCGAHWKVKFHG